MRRIVAAKAQPNHSGHVVDDVVIEITGSQPDDEKPARARARFADEAEAILGALYAALPGGTLDALFAQMAAGKATQYRVAHRPPAEPAATVAPGEVRGRLDASDYHWQQATEGDVVTALGAIREALIALVHATTATATTSRGPSPIPVTDDDVLDVYIHEATCEHRDGCTACVRELRAQRAAVLQAHAPCHTDQPWSCTWGHSNPDTGLPDATALCTTCSYDDRVVLHPCPTAAALGVVAR